MGERIGLLPRKPLNEIIEACEGLTKEDYRDAWLHLSSCAFQNHDEFPNDHAVIHRVLLEDPEGELSQIIKRLIHEAVAVGKELTLRKVIREFDPEGKYISIPDDWIGKGKGRD